MTRNLQMANDVTLVTYSFENFDNTMLTILVSLHVFLIRKCHLEEVSHDSASHLTRGKFSFE